MFMREKLLKKFLSQTLSSKFLNIKIIKKEGCVPSFYLFGIMQLSAFKSASAVSFVPNEKPSANACAVASIK